MTGNAVLGPVGSRPTVRSARSSPVVAAGGLSMQATPRHACSYGLWASLMLPSGTPALTSSRRVPYLLLVPVHLLASTLRVAVDRKYRLRRAHSQALRRVIGAATQHLRKRRHYARLHVLAQGWVPIHRTPLLLVSLLLLLMLLLLISHRPQATSVVAPVVLVVILPVPGKAFHQTGIGRHHLHHSVV